jgi:hypothetical protein
MSFAAFADPAPELAAAVRERLAAHTHHTIATLRRDGAPRLCGTEVQLEDDGELYVGVMPGARRSGDLRRDPRYALHSHSEDPPAWPGDAKVAGVAVEVDHPEYDRFRLEVREASHVHVEGDLLVVRWWTPEAGVRELRRK